MSTTIPHVTDTGFSTKWTYNENNAAIFDKIVFINDRWTEDLVKEGKNLIPTKLEWKSSLQRLIPF